jgi:hypothetical protein
MIGVIDPGRIAVEVNLTAGRIDRVDVRFARPAWPLKSMQDREAAEAAALVPRLFGVCGVAHRVAARLAVAQATREQGPDPSAATLAIMSERVGNGLRSLWLGAGRPTALAPHVVGALQRLGAAEAPLIKLSLADALPSQAALADLVAVAETLLLAAEAAGSGDGSEPALGEGRRPSRPDALTPADDIAVISALAADPEHFGERPAIPGRVVETGAYARQSASRPFLPEAAARAAARVADLRATVAQLRTVLSEGLARPSKSVLASGSTGPGEGWAAVETGRGRLYHHVALDRFGRIRRYGIVPPTAWNFHPRGPFRLLLEGRPAPTATLAAQEVERIATLFDPCVPYSVRVREAADA